jgi:hypothetical protein
MFRGAIVRRPAEKGEEEDIRFLVKRLGLTTVDQALEILGRDYRPSGFQ